MIQREIFYRKPYIELIQKYKGSGKKISDLNEKDLKGFSFNQIKDFQSFIQSGLMEDKEDKKIELYEHQYEILKKSLEGNNVVITSGTGSGKTEAFLLPLFAYLIKESSSWKKPEEPHVNLNDWWENKKWKESCKKENNNGLKKSYRIPQRDHETRDPAIRALILYPMNALVEDQLSRLRKALVSDKAEEWFQKNLHINRFYFGRYTGMTPVPGNEEKSRSINKNKLEVLSDHLKRREEEQNQLKNHPKKEYLQYCFPTLNRAEMRSRWDMQNHPPDILITNYSMLSIMMMRKIDESIFKKTKDWLAKNKNHIFHLIVDELHLYRGTAGAEIAYLIRLLFHRLGLTPDSPQLRILASSASLEKDEQKSLEFLKDFFGTKWESSQIISGAVETSGSTDLGSVLLPTDSFKNYPLNDDKESKGKERFFTQISKALKEEDTQKLISDIKSVVQNAFYETPNEKEKLKNISLDNFAKKIFGSKSEENKQNAVSGLFRFLHDHHKKNTDPSFRFHLFFKNIEGLWACTDPKCTEHTEEVRSVGKLYLSNPPLLCEKGHRVFETLYCECCGTLFFGGMRLARDDQPGEWELLQTNSNIERIPDDPVTYFVEKRRYKDYALFWPYSGQISTGSGKKKKSYWSPATLNKRTGKIKLDSISEENTVKGYLFHRRDLKDLEEASNIMALASVCPSCETDYQQSSMKSPIKGFRTGFSKMIQILAKELFYQLDPDNRKLIIFSDSREEAAQASNGIEKSHYQDLIREMIYNELRLTVKGKPALLSDIEKYKEPKSDLAKEYLKTHPESDKNLKEALEYINFRPENPPEEIKRKRDEYKKEINEIKRIEKTSIAPVKILFEEKTDQTLILRLKNMGVNPAGNDMDIILDRERNEYVHWSELFDLSEDKIWDDDVSDDLRDKRGKFRRNLKQTILSVLFQRLYFSFESSGLGFACINIEDNRIENIKNTSFW